MEVTGTADPDFLKPGFWVKFNGDIDKKTKATAPVNELEIVDQRTAMVNEKSRRRTDGADAGEKKGKGAATGTAANSGPILGKITAFKNNELTLETSSGTVKADLGPNPSIKGSNHSLGPTRRHRRRERLVHATRRGDGTRYQGDHQRPARRESEEESKTGEEIGEIAAAVGDEQNVRSRCFPPWATAVSGFSRPDTSRDRRLTLNIGDATLPRMAARMGKKPSIEL